VHRSTFCEWRDCRAKTGETHLISLFVARVGHLITAFTTNNCLPHFTGNRNRLTPSHSLRLLLPQLRSSRTCVLLPASAKKKSDAICHTQYLRLGVRLRHQFCQIARNPFAVTRFTRGGPHRRAMPCRRLYGYFDRGPPETSRMPVIRPERKGVTPPSGSASVRGSLAKLTLDRSARPYTRSHTVCFVCESSSWGI
jgi:hypothetical protein